MLASVMTGVLTHLLCFVAGAYAVLSLWVLYPFPANDRTTDEETNS